MHYKHYNTDNISRKIKYWDRKQNTKITIKVNKIKRLSTVIIMLSIVSRTMEQTDSIEEKFRKCLNYCLLNKLQFLI